PVTEVFALKDTLSTLEIAYPDRYLVTLTHENGTRGQLAVDVVSPKAVRSFEVFGEGLHLFWEGNPKELYQYDCTAGKKVQIETYKTVD
ncbi:MAG: gfo/Idh/MocA family oxidoreductase, partial [Pygmaiobacter sp.]